MQTAKNRSKMLPAGMAAMALTFVLVLTGCPTDEIASLFGGDGATVTSVSLSPATANVVKGRNQTFTATVTGTNSPAQTVTWSIVETGKDPETTISDGVLTVADAETLTSLTVKATSTADTTKSGTAIVTIYDAEPVTVDPSTLSPDNNFWPNDRTRVYWEWSSVDKRSELEAYLTGLGFTVVDSGVNDMTNSGDTIWMPFSRIEYRPGETGISTMYVDDPNSKAYWKWFTHPNFTVVLPGIYSVVGTWVGPSYTITFSNAGTYTISPTREDIKSDIYTYDSSLLRLYITQWGIDGGFSPANPAFSNDGNTMVLRFPETQNPQVHWQVIPLNGTYNKQ